MNAARARGREVTLEPRGLRVVHASSLGALLYPGFWYVKKKNKRYLDAPEELQKEIVARAIRKSAGWSIFILRTTV